MQTLPFLSSQTAQKSLTDITKNNHSNTNKSSIKQPNASAEKTPFQIELTRQARIKQAQSSASIAPTKQVTTVKATPVSPSNPKSNANANSSEDTSGQQAEANAALDSSQLLLSGKLDMDFIGNETADLDASLAAENNTSLVNLMPTVMVAQNSSSTATEDQIPSLSTSNLQKKLDAALENALSKRSGDNSSQKDIVDDKTDKSARWINNALAGKPGAAANSDADTSKSMLNALKELPAKEIMTATSQPSLASSIQSLQASTQANANLASQQIASSNNIYAQPGKSGWDQAISQKVMWMVGAGAQTASLTLNPPDLGPLQVVIHVHNDQADTTFISDNDQVRQAIESGLSHLREKMSEAGIQLGQTNINSSNQSQQSFQQSSQNRGLMNTQNGPDSEQIEDSIRTNTQVRVSNGLVDTFV